MKTIRKIACVLITALLVLATGTTGLSHGFTASADDKDSCTITITNAREGETYSVYKIFDVSVSDDESAYSYKVDDSWKDFITNYTYKAEDGELFTLSDGGYLLGSSAVFELGEDSDVLIAFATAAEVYATANSIAASTTAICETGTSVTIENLTPGWYLVTGTASSTICMLETVTSTAEIEDKVGTPTLKKEIREDNGSTTNKETAENKETVEYQITLSGVYGVSHLVLHDALPKGLTLNEDSISVTLYADETGTEGTALAVDTDYTVSTVGCTDAPFSSDYSCSFEIDFSDSYNTIIELGSSAYIVITYTCTVDTTKGTYDENTDSESLINEAVASYGENNSWTTKGTAEVDTFEFTILKTNSSDALLEGAKFTLQNEENQYAVFTTDGNGTYVFSEWVDSKSGDTTLVSGSDGKILVQGMDVGKYTLTETKAPDGYNLLEDLLTVIIAYSSDKGIYTLTLDGKVTDAIASKHTITVVNNTGTTLPGTGGIGTTIFYIVGGVIIIVAVVLLVTRRRVGAKNDK